MFETLKDFVKSFSKFWSKDTCYMEMEKQGIAKNQKCCGLVGGDRYTDYLSYTCVDCPYLEL